jgi:hypothetical protein
VTGLVAGDPITITYTTTAKIMSPAGQYPITPGVAGPSKTLLNYTVTKVAGTLTVTQ